MYREKLPSSLLRSIVDRCEADLTDWRRRESEAELDRRIADCAPTRDFAAALASGFGLIAEIKRKSPSLGTMRNGNVDAIARAYSESSAVQAVSVLTNAADFGMSLADLARVRALVQKPLLRKDFIFDEYQVRQARAYGADAILLMANLVTAEGLRCLSDFAKRLGMAVLFESHKPEDIDKLPVNARICGINSRRFMAGRWKSTRFDYLISRLTGRDRSIDVSHFEMVSKLPSGSLKVAESGVRPKMVPKLRDELGFHSILVGTSILQAPEGVHAALEEFAEAIEIQPRTAADSGFPISMATSRAAS
jgi:indole-3-glycerol phosphate synthase